MREALKGEDLGAIKRMTDALQQASHAMAEQMYKQNQGAAASGGNRANPAPTEGEVVDAEIVDA